jgi:hypothetical protein
MASTRKGSKSTAPSIQEKARTALESAGPNPGPETTTVNHDTVFQAAASVEALRMYSVRDGSLDPDQFKRHYAMLVRLYEELA